MASGATVRDKSKELMWRRQVAAQAAGGLSIRAFCKARGISEQSFHWWRRELRRRDAQRVVPAFVPVAVTATAPEPASGGVVEIVLPGDRRVQVRGKVDRQQLADVLAVLEGHDQWQGNGSC